MDTSVEEPNFRLQDGLYPSCLLQNLYSLWSSSTLCDVVLIAEGKEIPAHKAVLAAASPYFRAMFTSNLREATENRVEMQEVDFSLLHDIVKFIYTTELLVTDDNVYNLMAIADILQLSPVRSACAHFLLNSLNPTNCLSVLVAAQMRCGYRDLAHAAMRYTRRHLCEVVQHEEFLSAPAEVLQNVFQGRVLHVPDEGFLLKVIVMWVNHKPAERLKQLDRLTSSIHLLQVPMDTLVIVKQEPLLENSSLQRQIKSTINTILEERYDSDVRTLWAAGYKEKARRMLRFSDDQEVILALGGESNGMALGSVECLTLGYDSWKCVIPTAIENSGGPCEDTRVVPTMKNARCFFGAAYRDDKVFVVGGSMPTIFTSTVEMYSIQRNEWSPLSPLPVAVTGVRGAFLDDQLYVAGGQGNEMTEDRTWSLEERSSIWKKQPPMCFARSFHGLVSVGGSLYAIGGKADDGKILDCAERYDPVEERWFQVAPMHEARYDFGCAVVDHYIYVMGGICGPHWIRSVERYDTLRNYWSYMTPMSVARASFGVTVSDNRIYCVGGFDGIHYLNTVEKFNPRTNRWHCVHAMQCRRYGVAAATLRVPVISREEP